MQQVVAHGNDLMSRERLRLAGQLVEQPSTVALASALIGAAEGMIRDRWW